MTKTIITRVCPGLYYIERGDHKVEVIQHVEFQGPDKWIARAMWDQYYLTDPVATYRDAKRHAIDMLDNPKCL